MSHEPRLSQALRTLFATQRVAALGTLGEDGRPFVSMVPFAVEPASGQVVIHVSGLAAHTGNLQRHPQVSLLVMQAEVAGEPVPAPRHAGRCGDGAGVGERTLGRGTRCLLGALSRGRADDGTG
jgi:hypothetical protein